MQIQPILDAYKSSVFSKDVAAFVSLCHQDVHIFDMWDQWSYRGIDAWRDMVTEWFGSLGTEKVVVDFDEVETVEAPGMVAVHALVAYKAISAEGKELRCMVNRLTWVLKQEGGAWKIVHAHTSAPIDGSTTKAIFRR